MRNILKETQPDDFGIKLQKSFEEEKSYYLRGDRVICLSENMREILCREYGIDSTKISVIPNGIADQGFRGIAGNSSTKLTNHVRNDAVIRMRKKWKITPKEKIILFAGRVDEVKGVGYLIRAFHKVLESVPRCRLIIAGSGDFDTFMREAKDICTKITFTGLLDKIALNELYQIADVGVVPSLYEPFGLVAVEMMMHGLPIVATATSGLNEVVDEACGLKIPITALSDSVEIDISDLTQKIVYLLQNPAVAKQFGHGGRKRYLHYYTANVFQNNMLQLYKSLFQPVVYGRIRTLIVTGQHHHQWKVSHVALKQILENSGLFAVEVAISPKEGSNMSNFKRDFAAYQLVVLDYCGDRWPEETEKSFLDFADNGGGVVVYHAANNAFRDWKAYNQITGFGGWEGRDETDGPYIYMKNDQLIYDKSPGSGGSHGARHEFVLHCGNPEHPITKGLPAAWLHAQDELYDRLRGPGIVDEVLFWAYSDPETRGSGRDEIAMLTVNYGKARIYHTTLGHVGSTLTDNTAMQCTGFQVTLLRGAEWAATGQVTQPVPDDFPTATTGSLRKDYKYEIRPLRSE